LQGYFKTKIYKKILDDIQYTFYDEYMHVVFIDCGNSDSPSIWILMWGVDIFQFLWL